MRATLSSFAALWARRCSLGLLSGGLLLAGLGCEEEAAPQGPEAIVAQFISRMQRVHGGSESGDQVVELLWKPARDNLTERARRSSALAGRTLASGELIAPSWFSLHLTPDHFETRLEGDWAEVRAIAADGRSVVTRCVQEEGHWRVVLELPPLPPIRERESREADE